MEISQAELRNVCMSCELKWFDNNNTSLLSSRIYREQKLIKCAPFSLERSMSMGTHISQNVSFRSVTCSHSRHVVRNRLTPSKSSEIKHFLLSGLRIPISPLFSMSSAWPFSYGLADPTMPLAFGCAKGTELPARKLLSIIFFFFLDLRMLLFPLEPLLSDWVSVAEWFVVTSEKLPLLWPNWLSLCLTNNWKVSLILSSKQTRSSCASCCWFPSNIGFTSL